MSKKRNVILHIGRHKTGTTTLQNVFFSNISYLKTHGIHYPNIFQREGAHHLLSENFFGPNFRKLSSNENQTLIMKTREMILNNTSKDEIILFSSEGFQNCNPRFIKEVFSDEYFDVTIVCYFREQAEYALSSYLQEVHATLKTIKLDNFLETFKPNYYTFMNEWNRYFNNFSLHIFDRTKLQNQDIVDDFFINVLKIPKPITDKKNANPSLSKKMLAFKLKYNELYNKNQLPIEINFSKLYYLLGIFSKNDINNKFYLTNKQNDFIQKRFSTSNKLFFDKYMPNENFSNSIKTVNAEEQFYDMKDDEFQEILYNLNEFQWPPNSITNKKREE